MKRMILAAALALGTPAVAQVQLDTPGAPQAPADRGIEGVIQSQLDAFRGRDVEGAWQFASPMIQGMFGSPRNFGTMVAQGYPMVWDNSAARFLASRQDGVTTYQRVLIEDAQGALHMLEYAMIPDGDGWRINGVQILPAPDVGA